MPLEKRTQPDSGLRLVGSRVWDRRLELVLSSRTGHGGDRIGGLLTIAWPEPRPVRGVRLTIEGAESTQIKVHAGHAVIVHKERAAILHEERILHGGPREGFVRNVRTGIRALAGSSSFPVLEGGEYQHAFELTLPAGALPSHEGSHARVHYEVRAEVDVPGGRDMGTRAELVVLGPAAAAPCAPAECRGARIDLAGTRLEPGGELVALLELPEAASSGALEVALCAVEEARAKKQRRESVLRKELASLLGGPPRAAVRMAIPGDFPARYTGGLSSVRWELRVKIPRGILTSTRYQFPLVPA